MKMSANAVVFALKQSKILFASVSNKLTNIFTYVIAKREDVPMEAFQSVTTCPPNGMIDARYLHLEAEFFELEKNQSDFLLRSFVIWCESFFSEQFVVDWYWKEKMSR